MELAGQAIDTWRLDRVVGQGASAVVYRAWHMTTGDFVAVKILRSSTRSAALPLCGADEARWLERCRHPNVARVYATGSWHGRDYLVMELMEQTLDSWLSRRPIPLAVVMKVSVELLAGLAAAHRAGVLHRDIKPANVGLARDGVAKLLDFGIATPLSQPLDAESTLGADDRPVVGSIPYMAPEVLKGGRATERSDVYSAGVVIYELVTGMRPFAHAQLVRVVEQILTRVPRSPSLIAPAVSQSFSRVILQALAKTPSRRFPSALAMLEHVLDAAPDCGDDQRQVESARSVQTSEVRRLVGYGGM